MTRSREYALAVGGLTVHVQRKAVKLLRLRVRAPEGSLHASVPFRVSDREVQHFVLSKSDWIAQQQARCVALQRPPHAFLPGSTVPLWGVATPLHFAARGTFPEAGALQLPAESAVSPARRKAAVHAAYRQALKAEIAARLPRWEAGLGVKAEAWTVRNMRSRWGSCNVHRRRLCLNLRLVTHPVACLDYVLVHELAHLWVPGHDRRFWALVGEAMPDWQVHHGRLRQAGHDHSLW
ncbi:SprT family zinc-dependent metalloprotease [Algiphilus sp.]|uniref:M48 family metallopeptidase n=1 Tax=Algiphilus sp. TaxID=1872431 RepID=UPI001CA7128C|nr:M48 family metallopeptidase [Algiphilus acroporae]MCI5061488.1 M48 family metallopeptidase [Algiphilus sp.]MCR9091832.1 M48 family metallopeptidase [Pseudomonadota bacterium]